MITVLRNALGVLGELAVRSVPRSDAERRGVAVEPLVGEDPYLFPAVSGDGGSCPAAVSDSPTPPAAGRPSLDVPLVLELLEPYEPAEFAAHLRAYATELISPGRALRLAELLDPNP
ncbi:uncharacterized protein RMCC_5830 [Mycolicibacterium canariasense]|uniref:Uncharacterized protein n=1 Tax=Mycolicibacterium canariasense TaxID=228230 RepID=A0A124E350_MYCCR|nr:hypothetical protein [Mycolicibacterium canariasense]MCV7210205.1 hypothetical protein [Mycolicibacterium canariasense]ORU98474.1 hypothetical protein AWB94_28440 [Mycolicibacterium canariasense]GAS98865.1 uncharacterized protein RMCC_5830 [Mycolicibacterium canariasense]